MVKKFLPNKTLLEWLRILLWMSIIGLIIYFWFNPFPKYERDFINDRYHYKIVKQPGFHFSENQPLEQIVLERVLTRRGRPYLWCKDIYYGIEVHSWSIYPDYKQPESDSELFRFSDAFIENNRETIIKIREIKLVDIKPNYKGIGMSFIINDPDTGQPTYYYDTRVWAYGNMYVVHLHANVETTNTKESRAERDKDYSHTYEKIIKSLVIDDSKQLSVS